MKCKVRCIDNENCYKYKLWAYTYSDGNYREWHRTIYRKNELTKEQKERLSGNFADELAYKHYCHIALYGCSEIKE